MTTATNGRRSTKKAPARKGNPVPPPRSPAELISERMPVLQVLLPVECEIEHPEEETCALRHIESTRPMVATDLPANTDLIPWPAFAIHAVRGAWRHDRRFVVINGAIAAFLLLVVSSFLPVILAMNLPGLLVGLSSPFAMLAAYAVVSVYLDKRLTSPAFMVTQTAHGWREIDWQRLWKWDAAKFPDGLKHDFELNRLPYLDISGEHVRVFNAHAAPLPDPSKRPNSDTFEATPEMLGSVETYMKDTKAEHQDVEVDRATMIRWGLMVALLGGCAATMYWLILTIQDM